MEEKKYLISLTVAKLFEERYKQKGYQISKDFAEGEDRLTDIYADDGKKKYALEKITLLDTYVVLFVEIYESHKKVCLIKYMVTDDNTFEDWETGKKYNTPEELFEVADKKEHGLGLN